jgi:hypothetical protein
MLLEVDRLKFLVKTKEDLIKLRDEMLIIDDLGMHTKWLDLKIRLPALEKKTMKIDDIVVNTEGTLDSGGSLVAGGLYANDVVLV